MKCLHCEEEATVITIDTDCDLKQPVCASCEKSHDYRHCEFCDFHYAPRHMRVNSDNTPTCIYCVGERDFPYFEDQDH